MPTYPKQKVLEQYRKLPEVLKEAMGSMDTANKIFAIGKKFGLTIEQIGFLADEVGNIILGFERPSEFVNTLKSRLSVDRDKASDVASEVNHQLFFPLREALKKTHQIEMSLETFQRELTPPPQPSAAKTALPPQPKPASPAPLLRPQPVPQPLPQPPKPITEIKPMIPPQPQIKPAESAPKEEPKKANFRPPGMDPYKEPIE